MKKILLSTLCLFSLNAFANDVDGDLYGFIGVGAGYSFINSDISGDAGNKKGFYWQAQADLTYYTELFETSFALGYFDTSQRPSNKAFKMTTKTSYLEVTPRYRLNKRFSIGPTYRQIIGEELLYAPSNVQNINTDITTNNTLGLNLAYDIPVKSKYRMKLEAALHKAIDSNDRDMYLTYLQFSFGYRFYDAKPVYKERVVVKEVIREVIKTKPSEVIELDEQVLSFNSGSYQIKEDSLLFLESIASVLTKYNDNWQIIKIVGHTDINGPAATNKLLSEKRAQAVAQVFYNKGIDQEKIFVIGRGEEKLKSMGRTRKDHLLNRRVELNFVGQLNKNIAREIKELTQKQKSGTRYTQ